MSINRKHLLLGDSFHIREFTLCVIKCRGLKTSLNRTHHLLDIIASFMSFTYPGIFSIDLISCEVRDTENEHQSHHISARLFYVLSHSYGRLIASVNDKLLISVDYSTYYQVRVTENKYQSS